MSVPNDSRAPTAFLWTHDLQEWWENNDEKPTTIALGVAGFVALWATSGLLDAVNRLPLIGGVFEVRWSFSSCDHEQTLLSSF